MMVVLGGVRSLPGAIVGAVVIRLVVEWTSVLGQQSNIVFGVALVLFMAFLPNGLAGLAGRLVAKLPWTGRPRARGGRPVTDAVLETEGVTKRFRGLIAVDASICASRAARSGASWGPTARARRRCSTS